ncbi:hydrolytic protein [Streptomyces sp. AC536]|uniref:COG1470 family protein n=1 Tax=Streptomyces buecherae TaxID=2763006 RepID=UPI00164D2673|nr:hydrolytic protein [Streptomyces buecherae]MBC3982079.1 hydrolytic protein [Streptomyces buecherae]QNJ39000.1 hydrolytic protein [Streptomyces buecherae]
MPGGTASTTLTVRNDSDIVEAYTLEIVGDCAAWSTAEPARVSLYPGTSETVTIHLAPPRSSEVRAGAYPLAVRVLPTEHPEAVRVPETTVRVEEFRHLRAEVAPRRRRGWLRGRYQLAVRNEGNTPVRVGFTPDQPGEELAFDFRPTTRELAPGEAAHVGLRVRTGKPVWFGEPVVWPFTVVVAESATTGDGQDRQDELGPAAVQPSLDVEFVQIPIFPKWLLAVLAALLALILAWLLLVRPTVRSAAKDAANDVVRPRPTPGPSVPGQDEQGAGGGADQRPGGGTDAQPGGGTDTQPGGEKGPGAGGENGGDGKARGGDTTGGKEQHSATLDVEAPAGAVGATPYKVEKGKMFEVTDIVVSNYQGDEGVLTIHFGNRKITTIALETFRNLDYHWVTPIRITENATVRAQITCAKPGTPATGQRAQGCHEVVNVSGLLSDYR